MRTLSVDFAVQILNLVKVLKSQHETIVANQIGRAGTSIGANIHEAQYAHGKADFIVGGRSENAGKFLSSPNGLFGFLPTFYPQKSSILTEVVGENKKTLTIFSSLTKIL